MEAPARVAQQTFHQPTTNQPYRETYPLSYRGLFFERESRAQTKGPQDGWLAAGWTRVACWLRDKTHAPLVFQNNLRSVQHAPRVHLKIMYCMTQRKTTRELTS